jgi:hypothetical protein
MAQKKRRIYLGIKGGDGEIEFARIKSRGKKHAVAKAKTIFGLGTEVRVVEPYYARREEVKTF